MSTINLSGVLLTGGESRRMGCDKATMQVDGQPLWQAQLALLGALKPAEIFISARIDPRWRQRETTFVADKPPSVGPLSGIAATLSRIQSRHLLVLAIDLPRMTPAYLQSLWQQAVPGRGVVPLIGNRAEPLAAIYPAEAVEDFELALSGTDHSLQSVIQSLAQSGKVRLLPVSQKDRRLFRNLNEPGQSP